EFEYVLDTAREAKKADLKNVLVTNGYYMPDPWEKLSPLIDGMNIDLKSMRDEFYKEYINGGLAPVQQTIKSALQKGIHVELTTLLITGLNDSEEEMRELVGYVAGLDPDLPLHLSRYHPAYKMDRPATPPETLKQAYEIAREQLNYVYIGNIMGAGGTDSECPRCGAVLVNRSGYSTHIVGLEGNKCGECGGEVNFVN
ncbi:MAG: radical SAM protein, partial [Planctomycetes bacterium]|nr:radical SAM protein [Planctomycetota bacterium]